MNKDNSNVNPTDNKNAQKDKHACGEHCSSSNKAAHANAPNANLPSTNAKPLDSNRDNNAARK